ncbi:MAG: hypothetical protein VKK62_06240 [Synechococcaceae cyanobacterium]|nr:hypothetical protein [Synechococcaceae cyanobacterium]
MSRAKHLPIPGSGESLTTRQRQELACRLRLADGKRQRWAWAIGSAVPGLGLVVLIQHARTRRTMLPLLFGITTMAMSAFAFLTVVATLQTPGQEQEKPGALAPLTLVAGAMATFAVGHRLGQDRAARNAVKWLRLDG